MTPRQLTLDDLPRGETCEAQDRPRLADQARRVLIRMSDHKWRTLAILSFEAEAPEASVSARLRDLRRLGITVERKRDDNIRGLWWYRVPA
jgi:hypothetical protein